MKTVTIHNPGVPFERWCRHTPKWPPTGSGRLLSLRFRFSNGIRGSGSSLRPIALLNPVFAAGVSKALPTLPVSHVPPRLALRSHTGPPSTLLLVREDADLAGPLSTITDGPIPNDGSKPAPEPRTIPTLLGLTRSLLFATLTIGMNPIGDFSVRSRRRLIPQRSSSCSKL